MTARIYTCEVCHGTFNKTRSDEEAREEMQALWRTQEGDDDPGIVCDDCFKDVMAWAETNHPEFLRKHDS